MILPLHTCFLRDKKMKKNCNIFYDDSFYDLCGRKIGCKVCEVKLDNIDN